MPETELITAFWRAVKEDVSGTSPTFDEIGRHGPRKLRRLPYPERVRLERKRKQQDALDFLDSQDFIYWAHLTDVDPDTLRKTLLNEHRPII